MSNKTILNRNKYRKQSINTLTEVNEDESQYTDKQSEKFISDIETLNNLKDEVYTGDVSQLATKLTTISDFIKYDLKVNQSNDSDSFILKRDIKSIKDLCKDFSNIVDEIAVQQQRLELTLDDITNIVSKYYVVNTPGSEVSDDLDDLEPGSEAELDKEITNEIRNIKRDVLYKYNRNINK